MCFVEDPASILLHRPKVILSSPFFENSQILVGIHFSLGEKSEGKMIGGNCSVALPRSFGFIT
jgi:hypothetical protein